MQVSWAEVLPTLTAIISLIALIYTIKRFDGDKSKEDTALMQRLVILETKMDNLAQIVNKHNNIIERTYVVERDSKAMFRRIDENREAIEANRRRIEAIESNKVGGTD